MKMVAIFDLEECRELPFSRLKRDVNVAKQFNSLCSSSCASEGERYRGRDHVGIALSIFPNSFQTRFEPEMLRNMRQLRSARMSLLKSAGIDTDRNDIVELDGRLLLTNWQMSLFDGSCVPLTDGFIDEDCFPGWDTWLRIVSLSDTADPYCLLSWVPRDLVDSVNDAIYVEPASCMSWLLVDDDRLVLNGWGRAF
jgi:hypothetical protein